MCLGTIGVVSQVWTEDGVPLASVDTGSSTQRVCLLAFPHVGVGTNVLVHLGFVVELLEREAANEAARLRTGAMSEEDGA